MHVFVKRQKTLYVSIYLDIQKFALLSNSLNQIKRDVIWLCVPQRIMTEEHLCYNWTNVLEPTNEISYWLQLQSVPWQKHTSSF